MKHLNNYILEKFEINKNTIKQNNPDKLTGDKVILYSDRWTYDEEDKDDKDVLWVDCQDILDTIEKKYSNFMCTKYHSLSTSKSIYGGYDPDNEIFSISSASLKEVIDEVITGRDLGYEIRIVGGHIEIDCINSGSSATYYIYSLSPETFDRLSAWWEGDEEVENVKFLYEPNSIVPIKNF